MVDKNTKEISKKLDVEQSKKADAEIAKAKAEIDFTYTITNNWDKISKKFDGKAAPQDVIMTLLSCIIADVKTNLEESAYGQFLDIIWTEYAKQLLPHLLEKKIEGKEDK